ncbi:hypothetical protein WJX72_003044 [[Myrmecia] bisecta]|uniref:Uncharacterized protein n=1 Tax=[Myrmecia] bisecta TaxID=41462 RepID=A0AAW1PAS2_9CHLO
MNQAATDIAGPADAADTAAVQQQACSRRESDRLGAVASDAAMRPGLRGSQHSTQAATQKSVDRSESYFTTMIQWPCAADATLDTATSAEGARAAQPASREVSQAHDHPALAQSDAWRYADQPPPTKGPPVQQQAQQGQPPATYGSGHIVKHNGTAHFGALHAADRASSSGCTFAGQARQVLLALEGKLQQHGCSKCDLMQVTAVLKDASGLMDFNGVWEAWLDPQHVPAMQLVLGACGNGVLVAVSGLFRLPAAS